VPRGAGRADARVHGAGGAHAADRARAGRAPARHGPLGGVLTALARPAVRPRAFRARPGRTPACQGPGGGRDVINLADRVSGRPCSTCWPCATHCNSPRVASCLTVSLLRCMTRFPLAMVHVAEHNLLAWCQGNSCCRANAPVAPARVSDCPAVCVSRDHGRVHCMQGCLRLDGEPSAL